MIRDDGYYYDFDKMCLQQFPNCWCYIVVGARNRGKTYSCLKNRVLNKEKFIFIKRTNLDVNQMAAGGNVHNQKLDMDFEFDLSPFADINDDMGWNIQARKIIDGLGGFWEFNDDNELTSKKPLGFIFSLNKVAKYKGFGGLRECKYMIFDEFIAAPWERISQEEGNQTMDLYKTVSRDREHRGKPALKLVCLANANDISNPIFNTLDIVNDVCDMINGGEHIRVTRGICIQLVEDNEEFYQVESETQIYKAMYDTEWGKMAFDNEFSRNDFTHVRKHINLKNAIPVFSLKYKHETYYCWNRHGTYILCYAKHNSPVTYDLSIEADIRRFYFSELFKLIDATASNKCEYKTYKMYHLIFHFKEMFKI